MRGLFLVAFVVVAVSLAASAKQPSSTSPHAPSAHKVHKSKPNAAPAPEPTSSQPAPAPSAVVSYQNGLLTITAENARLSDVIDRVRNSTGAVVEAPPLNELVTVNLAPQPPAQVIAALLEGRHVNYVIVGGVVDSTAIRAIQVMPEIAAGPEPAPPPPSVSAEAVDAETTAAMAKALFIAQTGGDEGVWDNMPESPPPAISAPPAAVSGQPATR